MRSERGRAEVQRCDAQSRAQASSVEGKVLPAVRWHPRGPAEPALHSSGVCAETRTTDNAHPQLQRNG